MNPSAESKITTRNRLLDELIRSIRTRSSDIENGNNPDDERLIRMIVRQLRRHPLPATLLGASILWLLLAGDEDEETENESEIGKQIEDEVVRQIRDGFDYTGARLKETSDRYPWLMSAALIAGGLGAALFLPPKKAEKADPDSDDSTFSEREAGGGI